MLLYLQTQNYMFPIGGESVMCHESQLTNSLARETSTETLDLLIIKSNLGKFVCQLASREYFSQFVLFLS